MDTVMKTMIVKKPETIEKTGNLFAVLAGIFMGAGFFAPLVGMILAVVHANVANDIVFNRISTILFAVSIPLLLAGSHFLDVHRNRREMAIRREIEGGIKD